MPIRFQCAACQQPIEVDDEHAQRLVACPYCRKTITAPSQSTLPDAEVVPVASPLRGPATMPSPYSPPPPFSSYAPGESTNALAVVAFALACGLVFWVILLGVIATQHRIELEEIGKAAENADTISEQWQVTMQFIERQGGNVPPWLVVMGLAQLGAIATWLAALICGIIAVRRIQRRGFATAALVICGLSFLMLCVVL